MIIKRTACLAFTAAWLTGIATLPAAHAQTALGPHPPRRSRPMTQAGTLWDCPVPIPVVPA
jgi:hypothetical protein